MLRRRRHDGAHDGPPAGARVLNPITVRARNTATSSSNKIHDDEVARRYGFAGGLVPGVDVYAYLTMPVVAAWGTAWLERGSMRARFERPVYDGDDVRVEPVEDQGGAKAGGVRLELRNGAGDRCATAEASLPDAAPPAAPLDRWPAGEQAGDPPPASPDTLEPGTVLTLAAHRFLAGRAGEYLDAIGERLAVYAAAGIAHPGWVLRRANDVLARNVRLGPWIHVESAITHHRLVRDGEEVSARAVVEHEWERKGHRFVTLDVAILAERELAARVEHTAIYQPRAVS